MSDLYNRVLLWHKLVAVVTGGLALCSAKHKLNRTEAEGWVRSLRDTADEIESVIQDRGFILDSKGQRVVASTDCGAPVSVAEPRSNELSPLSGTQGAAKPRKATRKQ